MAVLHVTDGYRARSTGERFIAPGTYDLTAEGNAMIAGVADFLVSTGRAHWDSDPHTPRGSEHRGALPDHDLAGNPVDFPHLEHVVNQAALNANQHTPVYALFPQNVDGTEVVQPFEQATAVARRADVENLTPLVREHHTDVTVVDGDFVDADGEPVEPVGEPLTDEELDKRAEAEVAHLAKVAPNQIMGKGDAPTAKKADSPLSQTSRNPHPTAESKKKS